MDKKLLLASITNLFGEIFLKPHRHIENIEIG